VVFRSHTGKQEYLSRTDGPAAQDNLVSFHCEHFSTALGLNTDSPVSLNQDSPYCDLASDGYVKAVAGLAQVGQRGAHSHPIDVIQRPGGDAIGVGAVLIGVFWEAYTHAGVVKAGVDR